MKHFLFKHHKQIKGERFFFKCWEQSKFEKCLKWFLFVAFLLEQTKVIQLCVDPPMLIIVSSAQGALLGRLWAAHGTPCAAFKQLRKQVHAPAPAAVQSDSILGN